MNINSSLDITLFSFWMLLYLGEIVVDACVHPYPVFNALLLDKLQGSGCEDRAKSFPKSHFKRFVLPVDLENAVGPIYSICQSKYEKNEIGLFV